MDEAVLGVGIKDEASRGVGAIRGAFESLIRKGRAVVQQSSAVEKGFDRMGKAGSNLKGLVIGGSVLLALAGGMRDTIRTAATFEQSMAKVGAITNASAQEIARLTLRAREMGSETVFSASESAEAIAFLGMAGFQTDQILTALPDTLNLAAAGAIDLGTAADIASNILSGMRLPVEALGSVTDGLAVAASSSNTNIQMLGQSFTFLSSQAAQVDLAFADVTASIGILGNAGLQGTRAGTNLSAAIASLLKPSTAAEEIMRRTSLSFFDSSGKMKDLVTVTRDLERANLSATEQLEVFGVEGNRAIGALVGQGSKKLEELRQKIIASGGAAETMANRQVNTLQGKTKALNSAIEELQLTMGEKLVPRLTTTVEKFTALARKDSTVDLVKDMADATATLVEELLKLGTWVSENKETLTVLAGIYGGAKVGAIGGVQGAVIGGAVGGTGALVGATLPEDKRDALPKAAQDYGLGLDRRPESGFGVGQGTRGPDTLDGLPSLEALPAADTPLLSAMDILKRGAAEFQRAQSLTEGATLREAAFREGPPLRSSASTLDAAMAGVGNVSTAMPLDLDGLDGGLSELAKRQSQLLIDEQRTTLEEMRTSSASRIDVARQESKVAVATLAASQQAERERLQAMGLTSKEIDAIQGEEKKLLERRNEVREATAQTATVEEEARNAQEAVNDQFKAASTIFGAFSEQAGRAVQAVQQVHASLQSNDPFGAVAAGIATIVTLMGSHEGATDRMRRQIERSTEAARAAADAIRGFALASEGLRHSELESLAGAFDDMTPLLQAAQSAAAHLDKKTNIGGKAEDFLKDIRKGDPEALTEALFGDFKGLHHTFEDQFFQTMADILGGTRRGLLESLEGLEQTFSAQDVDLSQGASLQAAQEISSRAQQQLANFGDILTDTFEGAVADYQHRQRTERPQSQDALQQLFVQSFAQVARIDLEAGAFQSQIDLTSKQARELEEMIVDVRLGEMNRAAGKLVAGAESAEQRATQLRFQQEEIAARATLAQRLTHAGGDSYLKEQAFAQFEQTRLGIQASEQQALQELRVGSRPTASDTAAKQAVETGGGTSGVTDPFTLGPGAIQVSATPLAADALITAPSEESFQTFYTERLLPVAMTGLSEVLTQIQRNLQAERDARMWSPVDLIALPTGEDFSAFYRGEVGLLPVMGRGLAEVLDQHRLNVQGERDIRALAPADTVKLPTAEAFAAFYTSETGLLPVIGSGVAAVLDQHKTNVQTERDVRAFIPTDFQVLPDSKAFESFYTDEKVGLLPVIGAGLSNVLDQHRLNVRAERDARAFRASDFQVMPSTDDFDRFYETNLAPRMMGQEKVQQVLWQHLANMRAHRLTPAPTDFQVMPSTGAFRQMYSSDLLPRLAGGPGAGQMGAVLRQHYDNVLAHRIHFRPPDFMTMPSRSDFFFYFAELPSLINSALESVLSSIEPHTVDLSRYVHFESSGVRDQLAQTIAELEADEVL